MVDVLPRIEILSTLSLVVTKHTQAKVKNLLRLRGVGPNPIISILLTAKEGGVRGVYK